MPKFRITTLGCKVNQAESEEIARKLLSLKWLPGADRQTADFCVVNTCAVTQKAAMQSRQAVRRAVRANPGAKIVVTGCYAQTAPQEIEAIEGVDVIIGNTEKHTIGDLLESAGEEACRSTTGTCLSRIEMGDADPAPAPPAAHRTRAFLKIQDGCNAFCTYCIVPYARGRSRSLPPEKVLAGITQLAEVGYREVVLTGIHLGVYGRDLPSCTTLSTLMERIQTLRPIERVRLSSIEPLELTAEILRLTAESDLFCRHFHVPLQSGDDGILKKMGRPYFRKDFADRLAEIHRLMPDAAVGVDILAGFPGESETAFENTYELVKSLPVCYLHVFPFSARPGTRAALFPDPVNLEVVKKRCARLRTLSDAKRVDFYRKFTGKKLPVLIETERDTDTGLLKGISSNYLPVFIDAGDDLKNRIVTVDIKNRIGQRLYGTLCNRI